MHDFCASWHIAEKAYRYASVNNFNQTENPGEDLGFAGSHTRPWKTFIDCTTRASNNETGLLLIQGTTQLEASGIYGGL
jgi:hypothetical protein